MDEERLTNLRTKLRTSLWFFPSVLALGGMGLAIAAVALDRVVQAAGSPWDWVLGGGAEGAANLLATIAGSIITVTGVVFSITIVTLSLASSQLGPRLLRNFMRDRFNQTVLGVFIGTFLYALVALIALDRDATTVPLVVILIALVLTLASIGMLIFFIHHISLSIQPETVLAAVAHELELGIERYYPSGRGDGQDPADVSTELPEWDKETAPVRSVKGGYVEAVDLSDLLEQAAAADIVVRVVVRPGEYVVADTTLMQVWPPERLDADLERRLARDVFIGRRRTEEQDVEFALDQMTEVAVRALSPGINDPFTAMSALDRISSALCLLGRRATPSPYRYVDGRLRAIVKRSSYAGIAAAAFDQIRQYGRRSVHVLERLLHVIEVVAQCTPAEAERAVLRDHAKKVIEEARAGEHQADDMAGLERAYQATLKALEVSVNR